MTAEEFYKKHYNDQWQPKDKFDKQKKKFDYYDLTDFAEAYHQAKLREYVLEFLSDDDADLLDIIGEQLKDK